MPDTAHTPHAERAVTMLTCFPPFKGITPYVVHLVEAMVHERPVRVLAFKRMYPERLYPGDTTDPALKAPEHPNLEILSRITWYNPLTWIAAGFRVRGHVLHAQWWSYVLAPIYCTVLLIARLRGKTIVLTVHNVLPHEAGRLKRFMNGIVLRLAHRLIVHSEDNRRQIAGLLRLRTPCRMIPMGAISAPKAGLTREQACTDLKISPNRRILLAFGSVRPYKGLMTALEALHRLVADDPRYCLVVAGQCWEDWGPYQRFIEEHELGPHLNLDLDYVPTPRMEVYFRAADLLLLPYTHFDSQSAVGAVSLDFEVPAIVSRVGGLPDLVKQDRFICRPGDSEDLAAKIRDFFESGGREEALADLREVKRGVSWDAIARQTAAFYAEGADDAETGRDGSA